IRVSDPGLPAVSDQLGRRVFSGLLVGSMLIASAMLFAGEEYIFGFAFLAASLCWTTIHSAVLAWRERRRNRRG
ncbi:MAG: hypothetical protein AAGF12_40130, partial [Myxococcota bacterium]